MVLIKDQELTPTAVTDTQITLPLPANVPAGVQSVQVLHKVEMGTPPSRIAALSRTSRRLCCIRRSRQIRPPMP